jgi:hypothetical protein
MAYTTIDKPDEYFNTVLYTGTGATNSLTGVGFQPDFCWFKNRTGVNYHNVFDSVRGVTLALVTNTAAGDETRANGLTVFGTDGFTLGGNDGNVNTSGQSYASWNFKAGGTAVSNTDGSITSSVSASTTSGFSIVSYTGTGANATVGHGLTSAPQMIILKNRDSAENWIVGGSNITTGWTGYLALNLTDTTTTASNIWQDTTPDSDKFYIGDSGKVNGSGNNLIAYCFAEVKGYSKAFSYTGNGSADGDFVYCGFRPAFVLIKCTSNATDWFINDNKRLGYNGGNNVLYPDLSSAEATSPQVDILSNGFKTRTVDSMINNSGYTYVGFAFAENPFVTSTSIPTTAR